MKVAVDTRFLDDNYQAGYGYFLYEMLKNMTRRYATHEFIFISDKPHNAKLSFDKNVTTVKAGPATTNPVWLKFWYDVKLPGILKKHKADILIAGPGVCSLTTSVRQCMMMNDLSYLHYSSVIAKAESFFLKRYTKWFLQKADEILASSTSLKEELAEHFTVKPEKISSVHGAPANLNPLKEMEKEEIRRKYAAGKNYFLFTGEIDQRKNLVNLLKAFSVFKKRQKSDWKLVVAGAISPRYKKFGEIMKTYKYRDDIILPGYLDPNEALLLNASAYALVLPSDWQESDVQTLTAMKNRIPVIISEKSGLTELAGDAALRANSSDYHDLAEKLMLLYKDESLRSRLMEKGEKLADQYNWDKTADQVWQLLQKTLGRVLSQVEG